MKKIWKFLSTVIAVNIFRFMRIFPNNDPILGVMLPTARVESIWKSILFVFVTMASFDLITGSVGIWTIVTSLVYSFVALLAGLLIRKIKDINLLHYFGFTLLSVLVFDFITGPVMSSMLFNMPFMASLSGQIPFTLLHLMSGLVYTALFCPVLDPDINQEYNVLKHVSSFFKYVAEKTKLVNK
ncbi:TPA: hypothetical protein HA239_03835 [Candidatus Woesearchaeota archaeon]|nr:hypothetical protein QT06_C0001G0816 [archaeon GW2011_AR15]MBS3103405.1 hypothetical protein [Candidatus Woesearchaeota archaeon]HIH41522.1 hypothetical protein [Candidatus Woesearchaeota archaeon]